MTVRHRGRHVFDSLAAGVIDGVLQNMVGNQYYVSVNDGKDTNVGTNPDKPVATLTRARVLSNATIDWSKYPKKYNVIWVEPGVYDEYFEGGFYCAFVVGLDGRHNPVIHPSSVGGVFRSNATLIDEAFINLHFMSDIQDVPIMDLGIVNYVEFQRCKFSIGAAVTGVKAIDTENSSDLRVEDSDFISGENERLDYAIYNRGGYDKFAFNARYMRNRIFVKTGGIYVASNCVASNAIAEENDIEVLGTGIGIDGFGGGPDTGSELLAIKNRIIIQGAGDAIHGLADGKMLHNETLVNGSFAYEKA